jgi:hypothetical protein
LIDNVNKRGRVCVKKFVMCLVFLLIADPLLAGQKDFAYFAPVRGNDYNGFVRVAVPQEIITRTQATFDDIRIFNDLGQEVEYAIFAQRNIPSLYTKWSVVESREQDSGQDFILKRTGPEGLIHSLELLVERKPLLKEIEIFSSADGSSWEFLAKDSIVDLRPHVDVYDTMVELPGTTDPYLKVEVKNASKTYDDPLLSLYFRQIGIMKVYRDSGAISIKGGISPIVMGDRCETMFDHALFTQPENYLDDEGNTIINLGRVELFVEEVSLRIDDPYFLRMIELWTSPGYDSAAYSHTGTGNIYRIEACGISNSALLLEEKKCSNLRIKILNNGRIPLSISQVKLKWTQRDLFFMPQGNRKYTLYFGAHDVSPPKYSIAQMIPAQPLKRAGFNTWYIGSIKMNEAYSPDRLMMERFKMFLSIGFILLVVYIMGFLIIQLRNRLPRGRL